MPQVVADKRLPDFESLFKPYKKSKKYIHSKSTNSENGSSSWQIKTVNPW
jgi:hypothetical protein